MPKRQKADARLSDIRDKFLERCAELWDAHEEEFMAVLEDAEKRCVNVTFRACLDFSESTAKLDTSLSFSQVVKDNKQDDFDDPNAPPLPGLGKKGKKGGKGNGNDGDEPDGKKAAAGDKD